ncbi:hypothetical protein NVP1030O_32 [Vibrio phage 1.030.O._10N.222.55.F9]|nr:hypothetical protein NVP1030O_32 [Vibrio phage 1.030.O._10N.222.55.F9]
MKNKKVKQILIPVDMPKRKLELLSNEQLHEITKDTGIYTQSTKNRAYQVYRDRHINSGSY